MLRVSDETRASVLRIAQEDFDGASADETVRRLIEEHWRAKAVAAVQAYRAADPAGWTDYLAGAGVAIEADAPVADGWEPGSS